MVIFPGPQIRICIKYDQYIVNNKCKIDAFITHSEHNSINTSRSFNTKCVSKGGES